MIWNWLRRHPVLVDWTIAAVLGAIYVVDAVYGDHGTPGVLLALVQTAPLVVRRQRPLEVYAVVMAGMVLSSLAFDTLIPVAAAVAVYTLAAQLSRRTSGAAVVLGLAAVVAVSAQRHDIATVVFIAAAWVLGDNLGTRRAYFDELEEKAERLEREREANIKRAAAEEQARISRELHDVIAHNVSVMTIQAAAARDVFDADPAAAREALASIESTGRSALTELRRLLSAVRGGEKPELAPQPGLETLDQLLARVRRAGLDVELTVEGEPAALPAALDLSAYRIVQEALTNTLKHASARHAWVDVRYRESELDVVVRDDGVGSTPNGGTGRGLVGMRERVELFGGRLDAGPREDGGYAVSARLPLVAGE